MLPYHAMVYCDSTVYCCSLYCMCLYCQTRRAIVVIRIDNLLLSPLLLSCDT